MTRGSNPQRNQQRATGQTTANFLTPDYTANGVRDGQGKGATRGVAVGRPVRNANINSNVNRNVNRNVSRNTNRHVVVNSNVNRNYYTNSNYYTNRNFYAVNQPFYGPGFYNDFCSPFLYNDYRFRRRYRGFQTCATFLSLGFFLARPYSAFDFARPVYNYPIFYGDEAYYRPNPLEETGGPEADAITANDTVATAAPDLDTPEKQMLLQLANYVEEKSVEGRFQLADSAFENEVWNLELAQAPAVFEIKDGLYSVVAGFEGTLGERNIPSNVSVEFFLAKTAEGYEVRDSWISSANGIARTKLFQSPVYPEVKTWQEGQICPFSKQPMVPISDSDGHG